MKGISLKHRVIGALFIMAIMIIVIPDILDDSPSLYLDQVDKLPPKPAAPKQDKLGLTQAWAIKVGSFDAEEAKRWQATFSRLGWPSYVVSASASTAATAPVAAGEAARVTIYLGPSLEKLALIARQQQLQQQFALTGIIENYEPTTLAIYGN